MLVLSGCTSLLGISDPTPAGSGGDGGLVDSSIDSNIDAPPPCAASITLGAEVSSDIGAAGLAFAIGRFDAGLVDDIVVAVGANAVILHGDNAGSFGGDGLKIAVPTAATDIATEDFDDDGLEDFAFITQTGIVVRRQNRANNPPVNAEQPLGKDGVPYTFTAIARVLTEFLDGNFRPDLFVYDATGSRAYTANVGTPGEFSRDLALVGTGGDELLFMKQIDGLQRSDAVFVSGTDVKVSMQTTVFGPLQTVATTNSKGVAIGKFDTDNLPDLVVSTAQGLVLYRQTAPGTFSMHGMISPVQSPTPMLVGDVNGDGRDDIITPTAAILQCAPVSNVGVFTQVESITAARAKLVDVTADGKPDLVRLDGNAIKVRVAQ